MYRVTATIKGVAPIQYSKHIESVKRDGEADDAFEERCWMERAHVDANGILFIPGMAFKIGLESASRYLGMKIKGKGTKTYTAKFQSAVLPLGNMSLNQPLSAVQKLSLFVPSDGKKGGGKRVVRKFPTLAEWGGTVEFVVTDEMLAPEIFRKHLVAMGKYIGVLAFRPQNGGYFGRFEVTACEHTEEVEDET